ncbi:MAG: TolC family protein, partial [Planctomycetales bacterium]
MESIGSRSRGTRYSGMPNQRSTALMIHGTTLLAAIVCGIGCARNVEHFGVRRTEPLRRNIEAIDLKSESQTAPITQQEAAQQYLPEDAVGRPKPYAPAPPRGPVALTLEEARAASLQNNLDLQVSLVDPSIAGEQVTAERWRFEATFTAAVNRNRLDPPPGSVAHSTGTARFPGTPERITDNLSGSVNVPLTTGGTVSLTHGDSRFDLPGQRFDSIYDADVGLSVTQPLLRGAGFDVNTAGIQIAQLDRGIADSRTKLIAINVLAAVEQSYWNLHGARATTLIIEDQLKYSQDALVGVKKLLERKLGTEDAVHRS